MGSPYRLEPGKTGAERVVVVWRPETTVDLIELQLESSAEEAWQEPITNQGRGRVTPKYLLWQHQSMKNSLPPFHYSKQPWRVLWYWLVWAVGANAKLGEYHPIATLSQWLTQGSNGEKNTLWIKNNELNNCNLLSEWVLYNLKKSDREKFISVHTFLKDGEKC